MNILLSIGLCTFLLCGYPAISEEEKSSSPQDAQALTIPDSLDGCALTLTSKKIIYLFISYYTLDVDERAFVNHGKISDYYEKYINAEGHPSHTYNTPFNATITFSKAQWFEGKSSGNYTCKKIGKDKLLITWTRSTANGGDPEHVGYELLLTFKTSDEGKAYAIEEENIGGNISFTLEKSKKNQ